MYQVASSSITKGLSPGLAIGAVLVGHLLVCIPAMLNGYVGCIYGINFPVLMRSTFGVYGALFAVFVRGVVACICMLPACYHNIILTNCWQGLELNLLWVDSAFRQCWKLFGRLSKDSPITFERVHMSRRHKCFASSSLSFYNYRFCGFMSPS